MIEVDFTVPVADLALHCTAFGQGPGVLLLHAGGEKRSVFRPVAARLAASGFHAISVDQRGHGATGGPTATSLDAYASDVRELVRFLDAPLALVGASLGGLAALWAMRDANTAKRVRHVVLVDVLPDPDPEGTRSYLRRIEAERKRAWDWTLIEDILGRADELRAAAASLHVPLDVLRGSDGRISHAAAERFMQLVPCARVTVIAQAGHLVAHDQPDALASALIDTFGSLRAPN